MGFGQKAARDQELEEVDREELQRLSEVKPETWQALLVTVDEVINAYHGGSLSLLSDKISVMQRTVKKTVKRAVST